MAKIREALRRAAMRGQAQETIVGLRTFEPEEVPCRSEVDEEIPFIEVGGRETPIEASPSVLASSPRILSRKPAAEQAENEQLEQRGLTTIPAAKGPLTGICFRSFPPDPSLRRPVAERFGHELVALHQPDHPLSEEYRVLVQNLASESAAGQSRALMFLAATPQIDTTAVLLNLAITRARLGTIRTLVVDANLHRPVVAERLGLPATPGLGEVLAGKQSLVRAIQETGQPNLYALTAGKSTPKITGAGEPMRAVLRQLRSRFDWIFINAACRPSEPEPAAFASACDAVYLVLGKADAETETVAEWSQLLVQQGICLRGYFLVRNSERGCFSAPKGERGALAP